MGAHNLICCTVCSLQVLYQQQKQLEQIQYNASVMPVETFADFSLKFKLPVNIGQMQQEDASLVPYLERAKWEDVKAVNVDITDRFCMHKRLLYCQLSDAIDGTTVCP